MHKTTHPCGGTHPPQQHQSLLKNDAVLLPILQPRHRHHDHRRRCTAEISPPFMVTSAVASVASSWLGNRRIRYFFLLLCSPILLVLLCVALPFLCAAEFCLRRRVWRKLIRDSGGGGDRLQRCEEGCCGGCGDDGEVEEKGLLHRYLEDQLLLVGSMYDCGDIEEEEEEEYSRRVEDIENLVSSRIPLLR